MGMRRLALSVGFLALTVSTLLGTTPAPRKSPEFSFSEPSGKKTSLSSFKGKVVVIEFLLTNCPHCVRVAKMIGGVQGDLGRRGLQSIGVAFDNDISGKTVAKFSQGLGVTYPIGYSSSAEVDSYLGRTQTERVMVPQIVIVDRAGVIRAQSRPVREVNLEDENYLRNLIDGLLKERAPAASTKKGKGPEVQATASKGNLPPVFSPAMTFCLSSHTSARDQRPN
jgi:peroxiredoxin